MERIIILSNIGSASKKYSVYQDDKEIAWFHFEKQDAEYIVSLKIHSSFEKKFITEDQYHNAIVYATSELCNSKIISTIEEISVIGLRVVIPHIDFIKDIICTPEIIKQLSSLQHIDPIHISPVISEIQLIERNFSSNIKLCIVSDSGFHITSTKKIPLLFSKPVHTIGYHGLSCESVLSVLTQKDIMHSKLISVHLGGGSSVTAIKNNKSIYNSMEFSPLDGIVMSSRSGSIDPFAILLYMRENNFSYEQTLEHLYTKSGLFALSNGLSNDLRVIREHAFKGDIQAKDAITLYVDSIVSNICKAISYTQGVDTIVFTGTIGYRAHWMRELVLEKLSWIGCMIDHVDNVEVSDICCEISAFNSKVKIYVIQIDEMKEMHKHIKSLL
jgi:acetate kinase